MSLENQLKTGDTVKFWPPGTPHGAYEDKRSSEHPFIKSLGTVLRVYTINTSWAPEGHSEHDVYATAEVCDVLRLTQGIKEVHLPPTKKQHSMPGDVLTMPTTLKSLERWGNK